MDFPFVRRPSRRFGKLLKPIIPVRISGPGRAINVFRLLDSGADLSMLPYSVGEAIGLQLDMGTRSEAQGIGEGAVPYILGEVDLQIGASALSARVAPRQPVPWAEPVPDAAVSSCGM